MRSETQGSADRDIISSLPFRLCPLSGLTLYISPTPYIYTLRASAGRSFQLVALAVLSLWGSQRPNFFDLLPFGLVSPGTRGFAYAPGCLSGLSGVAELSPASLIAGVNEPRSSISSSDGIRLSVWHSYCRHLSTFLSPSFAILAQYSTLCTLCHLLSRAPQVLFNGVGIVEFVRNGRPRR